jgi:hypothetical protein
MSTSRPRSIAKILEQVGSSGQPSLPERVRQLAEFERRVQACLAPDLAQHCRVAGIVRDCLRLATDTPAWAARLRFQGPRLLQQLARQSGLSLNAVQVRIIPPVSQHTPPARKLCLTAENARLLQQTAQAIKDPGLARALERLARHRTAPKR